MEASECAGDLGLGRPPHQNTIGVGVPHFAPDFFHQNFSVCDRLISKTAQSHLPDLGHFESLVAVQTVFDPRVRAHDAFEKLAVITRAVAVYVQLRKQISGGLLGVRDKKARQCLAKLLEINRVAAGCNTCQIPQGQITNRAHEHLSNYTSGA